MYLATPIAPAAPPAGTLPAPGLGERLPSERLLRPAALDRPPPAPRPAPRRPVGASTAVLRELPLLVGLTEAHLAELAAHATVRHFRRGERLVEQDRHSDTLFVLLGGKAHATRSGTNGRLLLLQVLRRGDFFGELSVIDGLPVAGSVRCLVQCEVLMVPGRDVDRFLRQWPEFAQAMVQQLVQRLRLANRRIAALALHDVHDRVIDYLRDVGVPCGDGSFHARGRISRTELALEVGASREMVCRVMRQLVRRGIVDALDDGSIVVRPPAER